MEECPICGVNREERPMIELCENRHSFCMRCIKKWKRQCFSQERDFRCPTCRLLQEEYKYLHGKIEVFYADSVIKYTEIHYHKGIRHGEYLKWYPNGRLKECRLFIDGKEDGESVFYDQNGGYEIRLYQMGELIWKQKIEKRSFYTAMKAFFRL